MRPGFGPGVSLSNNDKEQPMTTWPPEGSMGKAHAYGKEAVRKFCERNNLDPTDPSVASRLERVFFNAVNEWHERRPFD